MSLFELPKSQGEELPGGSGNREEEIVSTLSLEDASRYMEDKTHLQILCTSKQQAPNPALSNLLKDAMNIAFSVIQPERGYILLFDKSGELAPVLIQRRSPEGKGNGGASISQTIIKKVLEEKTAVLSLDARVDPRFSNSESIQVHGIRSAMVVPLMHGGKILGIIHLDRKLSEKAFTQTDLVILTSIANLLAISLSYTFAK